MSQRGKRGNRLENDNLQQQPPVKRRKGRPPTISSSFEQQDHEVSTTTTIPMVSAGVQAKLGPTASSSSATSTLWQARSISDLKISSIYNRSSSEAPAELFRKDLISAMKLPDSEPLSVDEYWTISDPWKQEWERGVQVPVNPDSLPEPSVKVLQHPIAAPKNDFKLPKNKYVRITKDEQFLSDIHYLSTAPNLAESTCSYDLDQIDEVWLKLLNNERALCGASPISDGQFERVIEELEVRCWDKIQAIMRSEEGLGIEYDENVICDVCRSPDSEEANEMVFCDNCNICVHQACYGITAIPSGQWLCRTCSMGKKPDCVLCPNKGGAMKSTRSGKKWAHVSCALWIPEVSIGCVDRMEPITKISSIPQSRWALICVLCRERVGACIQCSVKTCKTAYHVTCAFQHGLEMRAIIEEGNAEDGVKLRSYCLKHSVSKGKKDKGNNNNGFGSGSEDDDCRRRKLRKDMTSEERNQVRVMRLQEVESEFDKHVNIKDISCHLLEVDQEAIQCIYSYWILKRKSGKNRPLIPPKAEDVDMLSNSQEQADGEKKKMFVHLRQDLERVRNLCYMVNRREKLSRSFFKMREQIFYKQIAVLSENSFKDSDASIISAVIHANNGPSVYDRFYSSASALGDNVINFDDIQEKIKGLQSIGSVDTKGHSHHHHHHSGGGAGVAVGASGASGIGTAGLSSTVVAGEKHRKDSYTKIHVNGISDRRSDSMYDDSCLSSNSDNSDKYSSSTADDRKQQSRKKSHSYLKTLEKHLRRKSVTSSCILDTSSDDDATEKKDRGSGGGGQMPIKKNLSLREMEKELAKDSAHLSSSGESEELLPIKNSGNRAMNKKASLAIYSDSESTDKEKTDNTVSDSQQQMFRTKAAMKEFSLQSGKSKQNLKKATGSKSKDNDSHKMSVPEDSVAAEKPVAVDKFIKGTKTTESVTTSPDKLKKNTSKPKSHKPKTNDDVPMEKLTLDNKNKFPTDLMVVPQRQAAKKAFENMRSTNLYVGTAIQKKDIRDAKSDEKENDRQLVREKEKEKERDRPKEKESRDDDRERDKEKERDRDRDRERDKERSKPRGRPPKQTKDEPREKDPIKESLSKEKSNIEPKQPVEQLVETLRPEKLEKSSKIDNLMVAYVPQRQAAKKAAETIKSGMGKATLQEQPEEKEKEADKSKEKIVDRPKEKEIDNKQQRKKLEKKPSAIVLSSSSSGSSSESSSSSSSSGESDSESPSPEVLDKGIKSKPSSKTAISTENLRSSRDAVADRGSQREQHHPQRDHDQNKKTKNEELSFESNETDLRDTLPSKGTDLRKPKSNEKSKLATKAKSSSCTDKRNDSMELCSPVANESRQKKSKRNSVSGEVKEDVVDRRKTPVRTLLSPSQSNEDVRTKKSKSSAMSDLNIIKKQEKLEGKSSHPYDTNSRTLEEEIAQRKADSISLVNTAVNVKNKSNRNIGSLDKLLNKKERERERKAALEISLQQSSSASSSSTMDKMDHKAIDMSEVQRAMDVENISVPKYIEKTYPTEVIDVDSESAESIPSKVEPQANNEDQKMDKDSLASGAEYNAEQPKDDARKVSTDTTANLPPSFGFGLMKDNKDIDIKANDIPLVSDVDVEYKFEDKEKDTQETSIFANKGDADDILNVPSVLPPPCSDLNSDPIFETKQNDEDSTRETINLIEKLRQKYKKSTSTVLKSDEISSNMAADKEAETTENFQCIKNILQAAAEVEDSSLKCDELASTFPAVSELPPPVPPPTLRDSEINNKESMNLSKCFPMDEHEQSRIDQQMVDSKATKASLKMTGDGEKHPSEPPFLPPKQIDGLEKQSPTAMASKQSADCFDNIVTSNFFKGDFVDIHGKENLGASGKLDCDYDDNTRMPYINPQNMWNENDLIQTRRSVSSSPSSISESNDDFKMKSNLVSEVSKSLVSGGNNQPNLNPIRCDVEPLDKHGFNNITPFDMGAPQFPMGGAQQQQSQAHHQQPPQVHHQQQQHVPHQPQPVVNGVDLMNSYNFNESNQYNGPVSLFPSQPLSNINVQMPFPSPGAALFPSSINSSLGLPPQQQPSAAPTSNSIFGHLMKHDHNHSLASTAQNNESQYPFLNQSCNAAFTSSSHNIALTAEIVSTTVGSAVAGTIPSPQMIHSNNFGAQNQSMLGSAQPPVNANINLVNPCEMMQPAVVNSKDSPSKRSSARFNQQIKSPQLHKSPGKSPRQMELSKHHNQASIQKIKYDTIRSRSRSTRGSNPTPRVRGRGRGRGRVISLSQMPSNLEFDSSLSSIHNNLAGTVYDLDFDEDLTSCSNVENLKSLRDRRRSFDCRATLPNSGESKFTSPKLRATASQRLMSDLKPPTGLPTPSQPDMHSSTHSLLQNMVHPVLPGPVDMRTYNSGFDNNQASQEAYNNHLLGAFASGTADQTLHDIDEEDEKEFQSALKASSTVRSKTTTTTTLTTAIPQEQPTVAEVPPIETTSEEISIDSDTTNTKVSLSDSRNQLKLKIKGPLAHPDNYVSTNNCSTISQTLVAEQNLSLQMSSAASVNLSSMGNTTGTSSLRRMRKKELLRQYWTQDMNMDDSACLPPADLSASNDQMSMSRIVGIPKAVDSMSSIPTKDDYKDYTTIDPRKRKKLPGMSRELRQLDVKYDTEHPERRRSVCSTGSNISTNNPVDKVSLKRRSKGKSMETASGAGDAPKLKIKIRNNVIETSTEMTRVMGCPPKKRLAASLSVPSLEILKRDCMNFRKQVMADFDEEEKEKVPKSKSAKKEYKEMRKKKKKDKEKKDEIQVIDNSKDTPKLIIRFGKRKASEEAGNSEQSEPVVAATTLGLAAVASATVGQQQSQTIPSTVTGLAGGASNDDAESSKQLITKPIRLKLARNSDGGGYVIGGSKGEKIAASATDGGNPLTTSPTAVVGIANSGASHKLQQQTHSTMESIRIPSGEDDLGRLPSDNSSSIDEQNSSGDKRTPAVDLSEASNPLNSSPTTATVSVMSANTNVNNSSDLKGQNTKGSSSKGCRPLLPLNKDCEVR